MSILSNYYFLLNSDDDVTSVFSEDIGSSDEKDELRTEINEDGTKRKIPMNASLLKKNQNKKRKIVYSEVYDHDLPVANNDNTPYVRKQKPKIFFNFNIK